MTTQELSSLRASWRQRGWGCCWKPSAASETLSGAVWSWVLRSRDLGIADRTHFLGALPRAQVLGVMADSDVFVLPSFSESCPYTLLEAMWSNLPVIASRVGDVPEVLADGEVGFLVEPGRPLELAQCLRSLLLDVHLRATLGSRGRSRVEQAFSAERMAARTAQAFEEIITRAGGDHRGRGSDDHHPTTLVR